MIRNRYNYLTPSVRDTKGKRTHITQRATISSCLKYFFLVSIPKMFICCSSLLVCWCFQTSCFVSSLFVSRLSFVWCLWKLCISTHVQLYFTINLYILQTSIILKTDSKRPGQTARKCRLIYAFALRTYPEDTFSHIVTLLIISRIVFTSNDKWNLEISRIW